MIQQIEKVSQDQAGARISQYAIVNLSSTGGVIGTPDMVPYCTTKAGVLGMTRSCALDLGKHNIRWETSYAEVWSAFFQIIRMSVSLKVCIAFPV